MNKHFNINYAEQESDWKDLTIIRLLNEISDLEERIDNEIEILNNRIDKAIEYIERNCLEFNKKYACQGMNNDMVDKLLDILKGSDKE